MVNLCHQQHCKLSVTILEINYIATNLHSFAHVHINAALKQYKVRLLSLDVHFG